MKNTVSHLLEQNYENMEILLVENGSGDDSLLLCRQLESMVENISVYQSTPGTTFARRKGIECSRGKYILFLDQDDAYISSDAVTRMVSAIEEEGVDIIQFAHYKSWKGVRKKNGYNFEKQVFDREDILDFQIKGILGFGWDERIVLNTLVWNKIYKSEILKEIADQIEWPLFFCEDAFLNMLAFFNPHTEKVCVLDDAYYQWTGGVGFTSSKDSSFALLKDYIYYKPCTQTNIISNGCKSNILNACYWDSLNVYRWTIYGYFYKGLKKNEIINRIQEIENFDYIRDAKEKLRNAPLKDVNSLQIPDIDFITSNYSAEEYYLWCQSTLPKRRINNRIKSMVKRLLFH